MKGNLPATDRSLFFCVFWSYAAEVGETNLDRTTSAPDSVNVRPALTGNP